MNKKRLPDGRPFFIHTDRQTIISKEPHPVACKIRNRKIPPLSMTT
jgi:hypothetical protein